MQRAVSAIVKADKVPCCLRFFIYLFDCAKRNFVRGGAMIAGFYTVTDFEFAFEETEHILPHKMFPHGIAGKDNACTKSKLDYQAETTETANKRQTNFIISIHCTSPSRTPAYFQRRHRRLVSILGDGVTFFVCIYSASAPDLNAICVSAKNLQEDRS